MVVAIRGQYTDIALLIRVRAGFHANRRRHADVRERYVVGLCKVNTCEMLATIVSAVPLLGVERERRRGALGKRLAIHRMEYPFGAHEIGGIGMVLQSLRVDKGCLACSVLYLQAITLPPVSGSLLQRPDIGRLLAPDVSPTSRPSAQDIADLEGTLVRLKLVGVVVVAAGATAHTVFEIQGDGAVLYEIVAVQRCERPLCAGELSRIIGRFLLHYGCRTACV